MIKYKYLSSTYASTLGRTDLCAFFYRKAFIIVCTGGHIGMVATNTIGQGDTRDGGLGVIEQGGGVITFARRFIKWPGTANVEVNILAIRSGEWNRPCYLDNKSVTFISSRLDEEPESKPEKLANNRGKAFQGSIILGMGFVMEPTEAQRLISKNHRNHECLFPLLNGEDINSRPDQSPSRWVIQFDERTETEASSYPELWETVKERVWPERKDKDAKKYPRMVYEWWKHWNNRKELYLAIAPLKLVLVRALTSELHMMVFIPKTIIYSHAVGVFAFDDHYHFALLQSNLHEAWVWKYASSLESRTRYTPTDCFETFPFPPCPNPEQFQWAGQIGERYHEHRREVTLVRNLGLTKTYNLFHKPEVQDQDIRAMRELHAEMDRAILACYGWQEVDLGHGFHVNERGQTRYTISPAARREILNRLLLLNHEVAARELADPSQARTRRRRRKDR